jgi:hypothetical protein
MCQAMQQAIGLNLLIATSEEPFSLDEFILRLKEFALKEGLPGVAAFFLRVVDELLQLRRLQGPKDARPGCPHCGGCRLAVKHIEPRQMTTSIGEVKFGWRRLVCASCGRSHVPLRDFLRLSPWQSKSGELERVAMEVFSSQSYRRASAGFGRLGVQPVPPSTGRDWVMATQCGACDQKHEDVEAVLADATGYKRRPDAAGGVDNQGEVRVSIGLTRTGAWVPLGAHTQENWEQIAADIGTRVGQGEAKPQLAVLDGGRGMAEAFAKVANSVQRCEWHLVGQLRYALYDDGVKKPGQEPYVKQLAAILHVQMPEEEIEKIKPEERAGLEQKLFGIAGQLDELIGTLERAGHQQAAGYLRASQGHTFRWLAFWLKTGFRCPRTTSKLERLMREIGLRLKKIAFGWSEKGAAQMTRILIRKIVNPDEWEAYWKKVLRLDGNVTILFRSVGPAAT